MATKNLPFEFVTRWPEMLDDFNASDPEAWKQLARRLDERDRELENFLNVQPIIWPRDSGVTDFRSEPWTAKTYTRIRSWNVELDQLDDGSDDVQAVAVDLELHVNAVSQATLTLPAGDVYAEYTGRLPTLGAGDRVTLWCEQTGFVLISTVGF